jgi:Glycosyltransferase family 87
MGEATTTTATGGPHAAAPQPGGVAAWLRTPVNAAIALTTVVALGLRAYLLVHPGLMAVTQYDDGPYFGSAVRLVHGVLPYRDFAFVQPPGITVLMAPVGLLTYGIGTAWGLVIGRFLTVLAGAAAVALAGLLVRHRGTLAVLLTCGIMALYPPAAAAAHTVLLEPWLVLFTLAGAVAVFDGDRVTASTRRLAWGGVAFGFAGAVKAWAIVAVLVVALLCLPHLRRTAVYVAGVAAGFLIPVVPFAVAAPRVFYNDVVVAQLARIGASVPIWDRLESMIGIPGSYSWGKSTALAAWVALVAFIVITQAAAWLVTHRPPPRLDVFATLSAVLVAAIFVWPPYFSSHYSAFFGPFLALSLALPVSRLATGLVSARQTRHEETGRHGTGHPAGLWLARAGLIVLGLAVVAGAVAMAPTKSRNKARMDSPASAGRVIPPGACVVTDQASYLLLANRFTSDVPGCSQMVDSLGTDLALSDGRRPGTGAAGVPAVEAAWQHAFDHAGYVLLSPKNAIRIPWSPRLLHYFHTNFRLVKRGFAYTLYQRT